MLKGTINKTNTLRGEMNRLEELRGYSAYDIAVLNGFKGTEEEWLASLKGEKGDTPVRGEDYFTAEDWGIIEDSIDLAVTSHSTQINDEVVESSSVWSSARTVSALNETEVRVIDRLAPSFTESGSFVTCEPVEGYPLNVTCDGSDVATITRCGKNLGKPRSLTTDIIQGMTSKTEADGVMSITGTATAEATNVYVTNVPSWGKQVFLGKGTYTFNCEVLQGSFTKVTGVLQISAVGGGTTYEYFTPGTPHTFTIAKDSNVNTILQFKNGGTANNAKVRVQYEVGTSATSFEPHKADTFGKGADGTIVPALPGVNNIWASEGNVTVTGKADIAAYIKNALK